MSASQESSVHQLIAEGVISGTGIAVDCSPIEASVKENNFNAAIKDRDENYQLP